LQIGRRGLPQTRTSVVRGAAMIKLVVSGSALPIGAGEGA
jgi:hypothetical protein